MTVTLDTSTVVLVMLNLLAIVFSSGILYAKVARLEKDVAELRRALLERRAANDRSTDRKEG